MPAAGHGHDHLHKECHTDILATLQIWASSPTPIEQHQLLDEGQFPAAPDHHKRAFSEVTSPTPSRKPPEQTLPSHPCPQQPRPRPNKAQAMYKPRNMLSLQPFPNSATCSAGTVRASGHQAKFQLCLPGTLQDVLALRCSLKITDVTPLFCILQCQEQGFFTNNPLSSLPRWSHPKQHSPEQNLAHVLSLLPGRQHGKRNILQEQSFHTQLQELAGMQVSSWTAIPHDY